MEKKGVYLEKRESYIRLRSSEKRKLSRLKENSDKHNFHSKKAEFYGKLAVLYDKLAAAEYHGYSTDDVNKYLKRIHEVEEIIGDRNFRKKDILDVHESLNKAHIHLEDTHQIINKIFRETFN